MHSLQRPVIPVVVQQHAEDSAMLRNVRSVLVRAPHVRLRHLRRLDDRIAAHLDGLAVAGAHGLALCTAALERAGAGEVFALAVRVIEEREAAALDRLVALAGTLPAARRGLLSAFGWLSAAQLQGTVQPLLAAREPHRRALGIDACRLHRVDPGAALADAAGHEDPQLRIAGWRAAGELGRTDLRDAALAALADPDDVAAFHAAACACMLGDRGESLHKLEAASLRPGPLATEARQLFLLACDFERGRDLVRTMLKEGAAGAAGQRAVIAACGLLGDIRSVPWLVGFMDDDALARAAGEAFSLITGADLAAFDLERKPPAQVPGGPGDDPQDDDVALDADESLPWPYRQRIERWWQAHAGTLPADTRCFMGARPSTVHCNGVLREGFQRQRAVAAKLACLQSPGTRLFPLAAPAWRQQRRLDA